MKQTPILFLGDSPELPTGLARIGRDLALLLTENPKFRVGYLGYKGSGSRQLPFTQYQMTGTIEKGTWPHCLPQVWRDFSRGEPGIVFTIWDLSRMLGIAQPKYLPESPLPGYTELREFLLQRPFQLWGYFPLDSSAPGDRLSSMNHETVSGYDRVLTTSPWAKVVFQNSGIPAADWLPHGIDPALWRPARAEKPFRVGVVASNQSRKDWGLVAAVCAELVRRDPGSRFWWHTDTELRIWSFPSLLADFQLEPFVTLTTSLTDHQLAQYYRACRVTLAPGLGEGFGYPIFESLACGVPVVHGDYASGADLLRACDLEELLIQPSKWRVDGSFNSLRPVYDPEDWISRVEVVEGLQPCNLAALVEHLYWKNLKYPWLRWFEEGL